MTNTPSEPRVQFTLTLADAELVRDALAMASTADADLVRDALAMASTGDDDLEALAFRLGRLIRSRRLDSIRAAHQPGPR